MSSLRTKRDQSYVFIVNNEENPASHRYVVVKSTLTSNACLVSIGNSLTWIKHEAS